MPRTCPGHALGMPWTLCSGHALDMLWTCSGHAPEMLGHAPDMLRTCSGHALECSRNALYMPRTCSDMLWTRHGDGPAKPAQNGPTAKRAALYFQTETPSAKLLGNDCEAKPGYAPDTLGHALDTVGQCEGHCNTKPGYAPDMIGHAPDLPGHENQSKTKSGHAPDTGGHAPDMVAHAKLM